MKANPKAGTELANWDEELAKEAVEAAGAEKMPGGQFISFQGGVISIGGEAVKDNKLRVIVLDSVYENDYFVGGFNPDKPKSPVCFALSRTEEGMAPHELSMDKQHDTCLGCPQIAWGTARRDGKKAKGKACQQRRRLALLSAESLSAGAIKDGQVLYARVPVTSVRGWSYYVKGLSENMKRPPWSVITEIAEVPNKKTQFTVTFTMVGAVPNEYLGAMKERQKLVSKEIMFPYEAQAEEEEEVVEEKPRGKQRY